MPVTSPLGRIAIVNRGEAALRFLAAATELGYERGEPLDVVAFYTAADRDSTYVRRAPRAYQLDAGRPASGKTSYLDLDRLEKALVEVGANAVWVGWGFVAEDERFAALCARRGITFIGPGPEAIRLLGDKVEAKLLAERVGVPVAPWSGAVLDSVEAALAHGERLGYPLLLKAAAGGGGRGIRNVESADELAECFATASREAQNAFGDGRLFLERRVGAARHVEVQVAADEHGTVWALGVRDCSIQRNNQKLVEESASTALDAPTEQAIAECAQRLCRGAGYRNVGTVEFLYQPATDEFWFMEVNTRLQVEHAVTELTTGTDLVKLQLSLAAGERLARQPPAPRGHAIEVRLNAEDPARGFLPTPGRITRFTAPSGPGVRVDAGVGEGDTVAGEFDSMIAKIIAWGRDRPEAIARMRRALSQTSISIEGGTTNRTLLLRTLTDPQFAWGEFDLTWFPRLLRTILTEQHADAGHAMLLAAVRAHVDAWQADRRRFFATAARGRPHLAGQHGDQFELHVDGHRYRTEVRCHAPGQYAVCLDGAWATGAVERCGSGEWRVAAFGREVIFTAAAHAESDLLESVSGAFRFSRGGAGLVRASAPGVVVAVRVAEGEAVAAGQPMLVVETMKLESVVPAPMAGQVDEVLVTTTQQVDAGEPLLRLSPVDEPPTTAESARPRIAFPAGNGPGDDPLHAISRLLLGYDPAAEAVCSGIDVAAREADVIDVLRQFTDLCAATERVADSDLLDGDAHTSAEAHLFSLLRSVERAADVAPAGYLERLLRVLRRHGVRDLDAGPARDEALARTFRAKQQLRRCAPLIAALLRHCLDEADRVAISADDLAALTVVTATSFPVVAELARALHQRRVHTQADGTRAEPGPSADLELWRLREFDVERLPTGPEIVAYRGHARTNPADERIFVLGAVNDLTIEFAADGSVRYPALERALVASFDAIRRSQLASPPRHLLVRNRITLYATVPWTLTDEELRDVGHRYARIVNGLGLDRVVIRASTPDGDDGRTQDVVLFMTPPRSVGIAVGRRTPSTEPIRPDSELQQRVARARRRGDIPPADIVRLLTSPDATDSDLPLGQFEEYELDDDGRLNPVVRPLGTGAANVIVGVISNRTRKFPNGMQRVIILGDPSRDLGALAEPECRRVIAAIDHAERLGVPVEWFAVSSGARVSMDSGTENMDWTAAVLRRIIAFTQRGGELNVIVTGVNVGAQSYFNAEATMLMHTKGTLIMLPHASMVLTGKQALDVSGGVSAEDNVGIGGYDRVMAANGEAQLHARDIESACDLLFQHYEHTYVAPGERFPRPAPTTDPADRDVCVSPHPALAEAPGTSVGDIFSDVQNPDRKKPFDIRAVMRAVCDADHPPLERWRDWQRAEAAVVWDAHLGGDPVCLLGIESHNLVRRGPLAADGPEQFTAGTLFPQGSKKLARAINAASGTRPVVVLANLSGFDGSPESLREAQLEWGAEIGRAVANFTGPMVFCVLSRYHGGAFVVFSKRLNPGLEAVAVRGSRASVLGGAPAAAVVFNREVERRVRADPRAGDLDNRADLRAEKLAEVAAEFDRVHTVERAQRVGSIDRIVEAAELRPYLIDAVRRGMRRSAAVDPESTRPAGGERTPA